MKAMAALYINVNLFYVQSIWIHTVFIEGLHGKQIFTSHQIRNHPNGLLVPAFGFAAYQI